MQINLFKNDKVNRQYNRMGSQIFTRKYVKAGVSVLGSGYYTFYIKDMRANVVPARLFNISSFKESGLDAIRFSTVCRI